MRRAVSFERQKTIFDSKLFGDRRVDFIGAGGVSGFAVVHLMAEGVKNIRVFDHKKVGAHNPPNQAHGRRHIGWNKTRSLNDISQFLVGRTFEAHSKRAGLDYKPGDVVFLCVDSMRVRKRIMKKIFARRRKPQLVIETRIDTNFIVVYTIDPSNQRHRKQYWRYWFPDRKAVNDGGCNEKRALRCAANLAADVAVSQLVQWFGNGQRDLSTVIDNQIRITMRPWSSEAHTW